MVCHSFNLEIGAIKTIIGNRCLMIALFACVVKSDRLLYLAVPNNVYEQFFATSFIQSLVEQHQVYLLIYDIDQEVIKRWQP
ncbi:element excision factor XisH family protein [Scytonema sp. HK-05]|uniref:element excision factor XisH family protein n=1 Tax=Scytonema sp. HK-05 TaxID=1137095 RepID=UPI002351C434|nr:element excision factor XisH family protein [Scytonema sp. HK-05]